MPHVDKSKLIQLQADPLHIRNICILAHVDHGKTTLADSLVASNGIISQRMAGKLRYLDSRSDEQERGITMKSSCISLYYKGLRYVNEFIINLIDSPGHVDFSSEVSTAVRLCDGAIILVDVVEGVCSQTRICLKHAYMENLKPILVLNKIDRLILEKKMTPLDAYIHMSQILEQVNAVVGNLFASDVMSKEVKTNQSDYISGLEDADDSNIYFTPESGNVIFCSAIDGWAFTIHEFARIYEQKLGILSSQLVKVLWGDYYYSTKEKFYVKGAQQKAKKPMFVQFVLENIWSIYDLVMIRKDKEKIPNIVEKLGIKLTTRDLRYTDHKLIIQAIFSQWLPIERTVLEMVVAIVPRPGLISDEKAERLMCSLNQPFSSYPDETQKLKEYFKQSCPFSEDVIVFISKMVAIDKAVLPENKPKRLTEEEIQRRRVIAREKHIERMEKLEELKNSDQNVEKLNIIENNSIISDCDTKPVIASSIPDDSEEEDNNVFIAFARVYSGTLRKGSKLYVLSPKHDPRKLNKSNPLDSPHIKEVTIENLYILMGKELENVNEVPAGNIVGIGGLQQDVLKTGTLSNNIYCPSFCELIIMATPILRVAVEPANPLETRKLLTGLKKLNQADACVQIIVQDTGEHVLLTLGEVHLERCVYDLENTYAKIKLNVSSPIVPFRETIVPNATVDMVNEIIVNTNGNENKSINITTANKQCHIKILALPLPEEITIFLEKHAESLKILTTFSNDSTIMTTIQHKLLISELRNKLKDLFEANNCEYFQKYSIDTTDILDKIWMIGPKKCGTNILLNCTDFQHRNFWDPTNVVVGTIVNQSTSSQQVNELIEKIRVVTIEHNNELRTTFENSFVNGFHLATLSGPLCEEPMQGVCFVIEEWQIDKTTDTNQNYGPMSGQIISTVRDGCRKAFQKQNQRLVAPMYSCNIIVNPEVLGGWYLSLAHKICLSRDEVKN